MALFCSLCCVFITWTLNVCADKDLVLLSVMKEVSELKSIVQQQNAEIIELKQIVQKQGQEIHYLAKLGPNIKNGKENSKSWLLRNLTAWDWLFLSRKTLVPSDAGSTHRVGFTAYRYVSDPLVSKQTIIMIIYDKVYSNVGSRSNHYTGVFTANISGLYVYYFGLECGPHKTFQAEFVNDGTAIGFTYCDSKSDAYSDSDEMVITEMTSGSSIWVRVVSSSNPGTDVLGQKSVFSGLFLS